MNAVARVTEAHAIVRVMACVTPPTDPGEVHEMAVADVVVGSRESWLDVVSAKSFRPNGSGRGTTCTPMDIATAVWAGRMPDVVAAHDAATASLTFTPDLTRGLRWVSLHKAARRVWPGRHSYDLWQLARWRDWAGPQRPFTCRLPSGAEREAELAAGLLVDLLRDPGLHDAAEAAWLEMSERMGDAADVATRIRSRDPVEAALVLSTLPARPLKEVPYPFDDQREWAAIGLEDLWHHSRFNEDRLTAEAARAELQSRPRRG